MQEIVKREVRPSRFYVFLGYFPKSIVTSGRLFTRWSEIAPLIQIPRISFSFDDFKPSEFCELKDLGWVAVNKFGAELDRSRDTLIVDRMDAAADAIAGFDDGGFSSGGRQFPGRGKP